MICSSTFNSEQDYVIYFERFVYLASKINSSPLFLKLYKILMKFGIDILVPDEKWISLRLEITDQIFEELCTHFSLELKAE